MGDELLRIDQLISRVGASLRLALAVSVLGMLAACGSSSNNVDVKVVQNTLQFGPALSFGDQPVNTAVTQSVTLLNNGTTLVVGISLQICAGTVTSTTGNFPCPKQSAFAVAASGASCGNALGVAQSCVIEITFTPPAVGSFTATLVATNTNNLDGPPQTVPLSGTGTAPTIAVTPGALSFGDQLAGTTSAAQTVTVSNNGSSALTVTSVRLGGSSLTLPAASPPSEFIELNACGQAVLPGGSCTITVSFAPTASGADAETLSIQSDGGNATVALSGTGIAPIASLSPTALDFGAQILGTVSVPQTVTLSNTGSAPLTVSALTIYGVNPGDLPAAYLQNNACGYTVQPGGSCTITVSFAPTVAGTATAALGILSGTATVGTVTLTGSGVTAPNASVAPGSLFFGNQATGTSSAAQVITVTNTGTATLTVSGITITGSGATSYGDTSNCATVPVGGACAISVVFTPTTTGSKPATVVISTNAPTSPTVPLSGTGINAPSVTVTPLAFTFPNQTINTTSTAQVVTVANTGSAPLTIASVTLGGTNPAAFALANTCGAAVPVGQSCTVSATFTPTATGQYYATITIATNAGTNAVVTLAGTGGPLPAVTVTPSSLGFGNQLVGSASGASQITVANTASSAFTLSGISITGPDSGVYAETTTCGASLAAGASCAVSVTFTPTAVGATTASLVIAGDSASSLAVPLTGTGIAPAILVGAASLTFAPQTVGTSSAVQTVSVQNNGTAPLTINAIGVAGSNAFSQTNTCGATLAVNAACTVSVSFTPTTTGQVTGSLTLYNNSNEGLATVALTGTGTAP